MVITTAKSLNREKYVLDKLTKQIENLRERETNLKRELAEVTLNLQNSKIREEEIKEANTKVKMIAEEEIMKNRKDHSELSSLREMKKSLQKEMNRVVQDNLSAKYNLEALKETKKVVEANLSGLQQNYNQLSKEKEKQQVSQLKKQLKQQQKNHVILLCVKQKFL